MILREIVYDDELQRIDVLKDNAKRANKEFQDALVSLKAAKAKQGILRAKMSSVPVPSNRRYPHETM
jgi:serine/threonine protein kinase HipA of HipAB toxin-antitoxin module